MTAFMVRPPAGEPVTLAEAKAHLRLDDGAEDARVQALVTSARAHIEALTRRALMAQGWRLVLGDIPRQRRVRLRPPPVLTITRVTLFGADGGEEILAAGEYWLDRRDPTVLVLAKGARSAAGIEVDFDAGYADAASVPPALAQAILMLTAHWFEHREAAALGLVATPVAHGVEALVAPLRAVRL